MDVVKNFTEKLVLGLVKNPDIVSVQILEEDNLMTVNIIVQEDDMGVIIGKSGKTINAIRVLVSACAYKQGINKIRVNVDSI